MKRPTGALLLLIAALMAVLLIGYLGLTSVPNPSIRQDLRRVVQIDTCEVELADGRIEQRTLPTTVRTEQPFTVRFSLRSYGTAEDRSLAVFTHYHDVICRIDGVEVYRGEHQPSRILRSGGSSIHLIALPASIREGDVELVYTPTLPSIGYFKLSPIDLGTRANIVVDHFLRADIGWLLLINALLAVFGLSVILGVLHRQKQIGMSGPPLLIGLLCLLISLYFAVQLWSVNYLFSRFRLVIYSIEYLSLFLLPYPVMAYVKDRLNPRFSRWFSVSIGTIALNAIIQIALVMSGRVEFKMLLPLTHTLLILHGALLVVAFIGTDSRRYPEKRSLLYSMLPILISMLIGVGSFWIYGRMSALNLLLFGVIVFVAIQMRQAIANYVRMNVGLVESRVYRKLAFTDALTGLDNRMAYNEFIRQFTRKPQDCWVVSLDLNHLKKVNDQLGHAQGDIMLQAFADILRHSLLSHPTARLFRIGGDEFLAFIFADGTFDAVRWIQAIRANAALFTAEHPQINLASAIGSHRYTVSSGEDIEQAILESDRLMYREKALSRDAEFGLG